ncbi:DUF58 domain-containing protein [Catenulispora yoronensis]
MRLESLELAGAVITVRLLVPRWGRWSLGAVAIDVHDTAGLRVAALHADLGEVEAFPVPAPDDTVLLPHRFPDRFGEHSARTPGEGVEFIAVRPYVFGDRQRRINWPATTRRRELQVNTFEAERATEAVVLIDALSDLPQPPVTEDLRPRSTLDIAVRGAAGLAQAYLKAHDRIGVVTLSGRVQWLSPDRGTPTCTASRRPSWTCARTSPTRPAACDACPPGCCRAAPWCTCSARCWTRWSWSRSGTWPTAATRWWSWTCWRTSPSRAAP